MRGRRRGHVRRGNRRTAPKLVQNEAKRAIGLFAVPVGMLIATGMALLGNEGALGMAGQKRRGKQRKQKLCHDQPDRQDFPGRRTFFFPCRRALHETAKN